MLLSRPFALLLILMPLLTACSHGSAPKTTPACVTVAAPRPPCRDPGIRPSLSPLGLVATPAGHLMSHEAFATWWAWVQSERAWALGAEDCLDAMRAVP